MYNGSIHNSCYLPTTSVVTKPDNLLTISFIICTVSLKDNVTESCLSICLTFFKFQNFKLQINYNYTTCISFTIVWVSIKRQWSKSLDINLIFSKFKSQQLLLSYENLLCYHRYHLEVQCYFQQLTTILQMTCTIFKEANN